MSLSILVPLPPDFPRARSRRNPTSKLSGDIRGKTVAPLEDEELEPGRSSPHSPASDLLTSSSETSPVTSSPSSRVSSRKPSSNSLPIFNRSSLPTPPVVHWCPLSESPSSSSSTLVDSPQEARESADSTADDKLRSHLQTCLDENKLANRSRTMSSTMSYCATLKGFHEQPSLPLDDSFQQLLTHATMLDFASEEANYEGLSQIIQGLDRGLEEFFEKVEELPFALRNTESFVSSASEIKNARSALSAIAGQLAAGANGKSSGKNLKRCQHERDMLLRAIRVFLDVVDFESMLQNKLSNKGSSHSFDRRKLNTILCHRQ